MQYSPAPVLDGHVVLLQIEPCEAWEPAHGVDQGFLRQVDAAAQVQVPQRRRPPRSVVVQALQLQFIRPHTFP